MATTTNFGWETPDDTDLVKDGAAAIRTALGGVDTSFVDLKGGTSGQVLSKASNTDLDFTWITAGSGKVKQVIFSQYSTSVTSTSTSWSDTGLQATITPTASTSQILIIVTITGIEKSGNTYYASKLLRNSTDILNYAEGRAGITSSTADNGIGSSSHTYLDSPATTSATTYKMQFQNRAGTGYVSTSNGGSNSTMTLLEIGA
jgi:hypothetical protein